MNVDMPTFDEKREHMDFLEKTLRDAGKTLLEYFGHEMTANIKGGDPHAIVTKADLASQESIVKAIKAKFPDHHILAEEAGMDAVPEHMPEFMWVIDPLDGSKNFESRVPLFGINIAMVHEGVVEMSAIHLPSTDEVCIAERGHGAFLNGRKIEASRQETFAASYGIGPVRPSGKKSTPFFKALQTAFPDGGPWMNGIGSPAVSTVYVADGRRDWYVSQGSKVWDYAAPSLILKEAGCTVTNERGEDWKIGDKALIASNPSLHPELLSLLTRKG